MNQKQELTNLEKNIVTLIRERDGIIKTLQQEELKAATILVLCSKLNEYSLCIVTLHKLQQAETNKNNKGEVNVSKQRRGGESRQSTNM